MLVLPLAAFVTLRSNPEMHMSILTKGTELIMPYMNGSASGGNTTMAQRFKDSVKVNRFGSSSQGSAFGGGNAFGDGNAQSNAKSQADGVGRSLSNFKVGG